MPFDDFADGRTPQLFETPPRLGRSPPCPPALDAVVAACLYREPGKRPPSMAAIAEALRAPATDQRFTEDLPPPVGRTASAIAGARQPRRDVAEAASEAEHDPRSAGHESGSGPGSMRAAPAATASPGHPRLARRMARGALITVLAAALAIGAGWALRARGADTPAPTAPAMATRATVADPAAPAAAARAPVADPAAQAPEPTQPASVAAPAAQAPEPTQPASVAAPAAQAPGSTPPASVAAPAAQAPEPTPPASVAAPAAQAPEPTPPASVASAAAPAPGSTQPASSGGPVPASRQPAKPGATAVTVEVRSAPAGAR